jgi:hypothetical protein
MVEHEPIPQVFLVWESPASGFLKVTDTFLFDDAGKIIRQNIVVQTAVEMPMPTTEAPMVPTTQPAWDNHFAAFAEQNVSKILLDYVEESEVVIHDIATGTNSRVSGLAGVEALFTGLFQDLHDLSDLAAPVVKVEEGPIPQVFLVWENKASGIVQATDTFAFDNNGKIIRQNIVVWSDTSTAGPALDLNAVAAMTPTQAGWDNHFSAFAEQNVSKILLDYTEESEIKVYNMATEQYSTHTGLAEIGMLFAGLFVELHDNSQLAAPVVMVEHEPIPQVFLVWESPASGYL